MNDQTSGTVDTKIAEAIFSELDDDNSGVILLDEFVQNYFDKQTQVKERIAELDELIKTHQKTKEQLMLKLKE